MKNSFTTGIIAGLVCVLLGGLFGYVLHVPGKNINTTTFGAVGDTNSTRKIAQMVMDMTTTTPASLINGDSTDRIVTSIEYYLAGVTTVTSNGTGLANYTFQLSTSTNAFTADSTNYLLNTSVATTTAQLFVSTSTPGGTAAATLAGVNTRVWKSGTRLNLFANGTSTATGTFIVNYVVSQ